MKGSAIIIPILGIGLAAIGFASLSKAEGADCDQLPGFDRNQFPASVPKRLVNQYCKAQVMSSSFLPVSGGTAGTATDSQLRFFLQTACGLLDSGDPTHAEILQVQAAVGAGVVNTQLSGQVIESLCNMSVEDQIKTLRNIAATTG